MMILAKKLALAGMLGAASVLGLTYQHNRKPVVLETEQYKGYTIETIGRRNEAFPGSDSIDRKLWDFPSFPHTKTDHNAKRATVDLINLYRTGRMIRNHFGVFLTNHQRCEEKDERCDPVKESMYNVVSSCLNEGFSENKNCIPEVYAGRVKSSDYVHEKEHVDHGNSVPEKLSEKLSHSKECEIKGSDCLPRLLVCSSPKNKSKIDSTRHNATSEVVDCMYSASKQEDEKVPWDQKASHLLKLAGDKFSSAAKYCYSKFSKEVK